MCPGLESNQHDLAVTTPSRWRVYQFRHPGKGDPNVECRVPNEKIRYPALETRQSICDPARVRTWDPLIKSQMLYQLSYWIGLEDGCNALIRVWFYCITGIS